MKEAFGRWIRNLDLVVLEWLAQMDSVPTDEVQPSILGRLVRDGLVETPAWAAGGRPGRRAYITDLGRRVLGAVS